MMVLSVYSTVQYRTATVMVLYVYKKLQSILAIAGKNLLPVCAGSWELMVDV